MTAYDNDIEILTHKIRELESNESYGVSNIYFIIAWSLIPIHLIGLWLKFWEFSIIPFALFFLYEVIMRTHRNIILRIEINTCDMQIEMRRMTNDLRNELNSK